MIELLITLPRRLGSYLLIVHRISDALRMQEQRLVSWTSAACVGLFDSLAISVSLHFETSWEFDDSQRS